MAARLAVLVALLSSVLPSASVAQEGAREHALQVLNPAAEQLDAAGYLVKALGDAGVATEHAGYAAGGSERPGDLESMQTHAAEVLYTLDPGMIRVGPGFGFGVIPSTQAALDQIEMAADAPDASDDLRAHARHVATCARNTLARAERMLELIQEIRSATSAEQADPLADELELLSDQLRNGEDVDGDGRITWQEGGLYQAQRHMELLLKGEGITTG
jgi:hypothetical protein